MELTFPLPRIVAGDVVPLKFTHARHLNSGNNVDPPGMVEDTLPELSIWERTTLFVVIVAVAFPAKAGEPIAVRAAASLAAANTLRPVGPVRNVGEPCMISKFRYQ